MYVDNPFKSPAVLSICPGIRGLERGVERALGERLRVSAYAEIEAFIVENLLAGMEAGMVVPAPIWTNLKTFPWESFRGRIHGIIGGYPCQPFSQAGLRGGSSDPRHLWPFIKIGVKKSRPLWCYFENVEGHLSLGLRDVCKDLRKMGYQVEAGIYSASEVGAPHRRNRVFILAMENSFLSRVRGWNNEEDGREERPLQTQGSGCLEHPRINGHKQKHKISAGRNSAELTGQGLANSNYAGLQGWIRTILQERRSKWTARTSSSILTAYEKP
jgi:site-specific DNA-cytosine methylase